MKRQTGGGSAAQGIPSTGAAKVVCARTIGAYSSGAQDPGGERSDCSACRLSAGSIRSAFAKARIKGFVHHTYKVDVSASLAGSAQP